MSASTFVPGARRDVVDDDRQAALVGDGPEVALQHPLVRPVVVGRDDERGVGAQLGGPPGGPDRRGGVVGARPGDDRARGRPRRRARRPISTVIAISRSRSAGVSVGDSPVVPHGTTPSIPDRTCHATRRRKVASSSAPSRRERGDEGGEGAPEGGPGAARGRGRCGVIGGFLSRGRRVERGAVGRRRVAASAAVVSLRRDRPPPTASNGWRPAGLGARRGSQSAEATTPAA